MEVKDILERLRQAIQHQENSLSVEIDELRFLFVATGPLQETSMSNGWANEFLVLAARFDKLIGESSPKTPDRKYDVGLLLLFLFAVVAIAIPYLALGFFGAYWSAAVAVLTLVLWFCLMPTSCMNGGLIYSLAMLVIVGNTVFFLVVAICRLGLQVASVASST